MAIEEYPIVCWRMNDSTVMGYVLGADITLVEADAKKLKKSASEHIAKLEQLDQVFYPPDMDEPTMHHYKIDVQLSYREEEGVYPLADKTTFRVTAVHGESEEQGFGECYLPFLGEEFYYYNSEQRVTLIEHYTRECLQHLSPEEAYQYIMPSEPWLEIARVSTRRKQKQNGVQEQVPEILLAVSDRMPLPKKLKRKISRLPDVAWERSNETMQLAKKLNSDRSNILLVGGQGVGKSTIWSEAIAAAERLSKLEQQGEESKLTVWRTTSQRLISKAKYLGEWQAICDEVVDALNSVNGVLWVTDFIALLNTGGESQEDSVAAYLQSYLNKGELRLIGEVKPQELDIARGLLPGFVHLFEVIKIAQMDKTASKRVLEHYSEYARQNLNFVIDSAALELSFQLVSRYVKYEMSPGKHIKFLGECLKNGVQSSQTHLDSQFVISQFHKYTGLPDTLLRDDVVLTKADIKSFFDKRIMGQEDAIDSLTSTVQMFKAGLNDPEKPIATLLFAGPTGVGKTAATKALAQFFFSMGQSRNPLFSIDMSEFQHPAQVTRLVGDRNMPGKLVQHVRSHPFSVVLFDEIEKAHPSIFDILLTVLDEGLLTDRFGRTTDFRSCIIVMTTNLGVESGGALGFSSNAREPVSITEIKKHFRPEFYNRIDNVVIFSPLNEAAIYSIVERELGLLMERDSLKTQEVKVTFTQALVQFIANVGFSAKYGARPIQRAIEKHVVSAMAEKLLTVSRCKSIALDFKGGDVQVEAKV